PARPPIAVIEDQNVSFAGKALGDPMSIVLHKQLLVRFGAAAISARVAIAVKEIAALAAATTRMAGRLGRRRAMVDYPELAERVNAHDNLIQFGIVGHAVKVRPIVIGAWRWSGGRLSGRGGGLSGRAAGGLGLVRTGFGRDHRLKVVFAIVDVD